MPAVPPHNWERRGEGGGSGRRRKGGKGVGWEGRGGWEGRERREMGMGEKEDKKEEGREKEEERGRKKKEEGKDKKRCQPFFFKCSSVNDS